MSGTLSPVPWKMYTFVDASGVPLAGYWLWTYTAGTTTPATTYSDVTLATPNTNPIVLNSAGRPPQPIYLPAASFKYILTAANGDPASPYLTEDNIPSTGLLTSTIGSVLNQFGGEENCYTVATSYPSGTTYDTLLANSAIIPIDSANLVGTFALRGMLKSSAGTTTAALVNLSDGSPDTAIVTIASSSSTGQSQTSSAITFAASGASKNYAIKIKVSAGYGSAWACELVRLT